MWGKYALNILRCAKPYRAPVTQYLIVICPHSPEKRDTVIPTDGRSYCPRKTYVSNTVILPKQGTSPHYRRRGEEVFHHFSVFVFDDIYNNKSTLITKSTEEQDLKHTVPLTQSSTDSRGFEIYPSRE
jgi:hypothetical protein